MPITKYAPQRNVKGLGNITLPEYLDINRGGKGWGAPITLWHITTADNIEKIKSDGLLAGTCSHWMSNNASRTPAVYFFCDESVLADMAKALLDEGVTPAIIEVVIPADETENLFADNYWNMEVEKAYMSAVKFLTDGRVPPAWITKIN
jgi:hypothetical protein